MAPAATESRDGVGKSRVPGGYIDVPRYLYDAILAAPGLSGALLKVVLVIVRLTWGYYPAKNCDGARISRRTVAKYARLSKRTVDASMTTLIAAGIVEQLTPPTGRRAAAVRINPDPHLWGRFEPVEYAAPSTLDACLAVKPVEYPATRTQSTSDRVPRVRQIEDSTGSPVLPSSTLPSLEDGSGSADAPPPSEGRPRCFYLPDWGEVYEHDTWAAEQPDTRPLYIATFGEPSGNGDRK